MANNTITTVNFNDGDVVTKDKINSFIDTDEMNAAIEAALVQIREDIVAIKNGGIVNNINDKTGSVSFVSSDNSVTITPSSSQFNFTVKTPEAKEDQLTGSSVIEVTTSNGVILIDSALLRTIQTLLKANSDSPTTIANTTKLHAYYAP